MPLFYSFTDEWSLGFWPSVEFSGESGAAVSDSIIYGASMALTRSFGKDLLIGLVWGAYAQLEEDSFFPFFIIDWKINNHFRLSNPFQVDPAGPAGLELIYAPADKWKIGVGGAWRSFRFRLDDNNTVSGGVGQDEYLVTFVRVQRKF